MYPLYRYIVRDDPARPPKLASNSDEDAGLLANGYLPWADAPRFGETSESVPIAAAHSLQVDEPSLGDLRAQYEALTGETPDGRWGEKRLRDEIAALGGGNNG